MIKTLDAIKTARSLLGTPYSELDCINLIKKVIRTAPGGVSGYTTAGTNTLWDSYNSSAKYRDLTWRQEGIAGARAGMLAFKRYGSDDEGHVGLVTGEGTVIHSSSVNGRGVVETPLSSSEGWDLLGIHRHIEAADDVAESGEAAVESYKMQVRLQDESSSLNVRNAPSKKGDIIDRIGHGTVVTVQVEDGDWKFVVYDGGSGYVSADYLIPYDEPEAELPENVPDQRQAIMIIDSAGNRFYPVGDFEVLVGSAD